MIVECTVIFVFVWKAEVINLKPQHQSITCNPYGRSGDL